jgi:heme exporter protein C
MFPSTNYQYQVPINSERLTAILPMYHLSKTNLQVYAVLRVVVALWLTGVIVAGFLREIPQIQILEQTARNLYFHVPMWFTLMVASLVSAWHSFQVLRHAGRPEAALFVRDIRALQAARAGITFGLLGLVTGIWWSRFTWYVDADLWWNFDPKQSLVVIQLMIFGAYFLLRTAMDDPARRARIAAVYNLFAFATMPFLLYVIPRQMDSLHPGGEGSPAFSQTDLAPVMRPVFYAAVLGFIGLFWLLYTQRVRMALLKHRLEGEGEL